MRIICDTAAMFKPEEGEKLGVKVLPLNVTINNKTYREYVEMDTMPFIDLVKAGGIPSSSQPSVGLVMDAFEESDEEAIAITMADGLSGTYQTFEGVKQSMEQRGENITVINTRTLAGPENMLVRKALKMKEEGKSKQEIVDALNYSMDEHVSFLIPSDFDFLRRGGRLSPLAATIGSVIKIVPVLKTSEDSKILEKFAIKRTIRSAISDICDYFKGMNVNDKHAIYIVHAGVPELAEKIKGWIKEVFPDTSIDIMLLTPVFVTQGGPGCVAIQVIRK